MRKAIAVVAVISCALAQQQFQYKPQIPPSSEFHRPPDTYATPIYPDRGAAGLARLLREINTRASLILFTAHPDDEDGGMLAYESRGQGARAALLTLNRGEGGQNVMSMDLYD